MKKIFVAIFLVSILISCWKKEETILVKDISNKEIIQVQDIKTDSWTISESWSVNEDNQPQDLSVSWLEEDFVRFNKNYKLALYDSWKANSWAINEINVVVEEAWNLISKYRWAKVKWFEKTADLDEKLVSLWVYSLNASDFATSWKMESAHTELEKIRILISEIRQQNWIVSISDDMLKVHNKMEEIVWSPDKKNKDKIEELKQLTNVLKTYNTDNDEYKNMLWEFEKKITNLWQSSWEEYKKELIMLKSLYIKMYLKFG